MDIKPGWKGGTRITFDGKGAVRAACTACRSHPPCCTAGMQQAQTNRHHAHVHLWWGWELRDKHRHAFQDSKRVWTWLSPCLPCYCRTCARTQAISICEALGGCD